MNTLDAPSSAPSAGKLLACARCQQSLPLRAAKPNDVPFDWQCTSCGGVVSGLLVLHCDAAIKGRVRLHRFHSPAPAAAKLPTALSAVPPLVNDGKSGSRTFSVAVSVLGLDEFLHPDSMVVTMLTRSISTTNVALLHVSPCTSPHLALQLPSHNAVPLQLVARVDSCTPLGAAWQINGRFTRRLGGETPPTT